MFAPRSGASTLASLPNILPPLISRQRVGNLSHSRGLVREALFRNPADTPTRSDKEWMFSLIVVVITAAAAVSNEALLGGGGGIFKFGKTFNVVNCRARACVPTL